MKKQISEMFKKALDSKKETFHFKNDGERYHFILQSFYFKLNKRLTHSHIDTIINLFLTYVGIHKITDSEINNMDVAVDVVGNRIVFDFGERSIKLSILSPSFIEYKVQGIL